MSEDNTTAVEEIQAALAAARAAIHRIDDLHRQVLVVDFGGGLSAGWLHAHMQTANAAIAALEHSLAKAFETH